MPIVTAPYTIEALLDEDGCRRRLALEVRGGLTRRPRELPATLFYDGTGSALFERITELPEYYLTRAECSILQERAVSLVRDVAPRDLVELGAGGGRKIRYLLDALDPREGVRYLPMDVDATLVGRVARGLSDDYPFLRVHGLVADFLEHLDRIPSPIGPRLVIFFGSTIGNLHPAARREFLRAVGALLRPGDRLLLGVDLVKARSVLELAYNDQVGVTAAFNRNILRVVNREFEGDFRPEAYRHRAIYNEEAARIEMHLLPMSYQTVTLRLLGLRTEISPFETVWTESSYKFTRGSVAAMLAEAGLGLERWYTDPRSLFALAVAQLA
jgi:L-histidine N-alpha-methyltransferase